MKFTEAEKIEIMATAHGHLREWRAEQQRCGGGDKFVTKTVENARVAPVTPAPDDVNGIDDAGIRSVLEIAGEAHGRLQREVRAAHRQCDAEIRTLKREVASLRDELELRLSLKNELAALKAEAAEARQQARERELEGLRRELGTLRNEIELKLNLKSELAAARAEVEELRQRAPSFKAELDGLHEQVAKQQKIISRLRGEQSQIGYVQQQLDAELSQMKRNSASPAAVVQFETSSSRITVGNLHPDAANALREFASQVVDAEDGDPILFSGPAGTA
jgi:predicted RNase H-like nuclease (RuvC/YqgF family)